MNFRGRYGSLGDGKKKSKQEYDFRENLKEDIKVRRTTMENITIKDIVNVTGGTLLCGDENKEIKRFSIDSRVGDKDSLFVPIIGEKVDAHKFLLNAIQLNGAALTSEHDEMDLDKPVVRVDDTVKAMQKIGTFYRNKMDLPVVAVTGSVGKTTTREMIAHVLSSSLRVFQTPGNQNSQPS